ncbi:MAG: 16S rRNA (adenine(1518)-N(6)/adenine(1519)-N(6))-dimethyltransferase RsmA [Candidatus Thermoplasmatota archaeon]
MSRARPKLGQHFLRDARYADRAVEAAKLVADDVVLEVGPGTGVLTRRLIATGARVIAVELDKELADGIARDLPRVELIRGDAVQVELPRFSACVSNLPYQISSPFLFRLLEREFRVAVLLLQKEFADRLVAKPGSGDYGRLTVNASRRADIKILTKVPPGAFDPPPRVDSALVMLTPRAPGFDVPPNFDAVVERAFAQRRKKLSNTLGKKDIPHANRRPEELTPQEFADVARSLSAK